MDIPMSGMSMASPSATSSSMPTSTSMSMAMPMTMQMTFFTSTTTPLYSTAWTPSNQGQYAGTCIFLILLSFLARLLYALKARVESRWHAQNVQRRFIHVRPPRKGRGEKDAHDSSDEEDDAARAEILAAKGAATEGTLTVNGVDARVKVVQRANGNVEVQPFRLSVDLARAAMGTVILGVGYLLMLAVMTMNVGYFLSVLGGAFLGELVFGRWAPHVVGGH